MSIKQAWEKVWCGLAHQHEWTLYGGFSRYGPRPHGGLFLHCNHCCAWTGDREAHKTGVRGIPYNECSPELQAAADKLAKEAYE